MLLMVRGHAEWSGSIRISDSGDDPKLLLTLAAADQQLPLSKNASTTYTQISHPTGTWEEVLCMPIQTKSRSEKEI